jgi:putative oxidoreductase
MASNPTTPAVPDSLSGRLAAENQDVILLAGRLALGAIFVKSGLQKLLALSAFAASLAGRGVPQSSFWAVVGATVEFVAASWSYRPQAEPRIAADDLTVIVATGISHRCWEYTEAAAVCRRASSYLRFSLASSVLFAAGAGRFSLRPPAGRARPEPAASPGSRMRTISGAP